MSSGSVTLTAIWNSSGAVNITFDPNGGVWSDDTKTSRNDPSVAVGGTFDVHEIPTLAGHTFDGWASSDTAKKRYSRVKVLWYFYTLPYFVLHAYSKTPNRRLLAKNLTA